MDVRRAVEAYEMRVNLDRRMRELAALCEIGAHITSVLDLNEVIQRILDGVVDSLGFDRAFLMLIDERDNQLVNRGCAGVEGEALHYFTQLTYDLDREDVAAVRSVKQNRPLLMEDLADAPAPVDWAAVGSFVTAPLWVGDKGIGMLIADHTGADERVTPHDQQVLTGFASQAAIAIENARLYGEALEKQRMEKELNVAAFIQQHLFPRSWPQPDGFEIAASSRPSRSVGGDYFDIVEDTSGRLWTALGDVTDKGVPAALTMATLRALFHAALDQQHSLAEIIRHISDGLCRCTPPEVFATFSCGILDPAARTFTYINAGHPFRS